MIIIRRCDANVRLGDLEMHCDLLPRACLQTNVWIGGMVCIQLSVCFDVMPGTS